MPWTLYRYILKDIVKLLVLSTSVLVSVISFAAAIKPLSDGLLDIGGLIKFVAATAPTMLVYALPFSAAFAVTLTFSRLTTDNEITACSAGGLSYGAILLPVAGLGAVLMVLLFIMSNWVLPRFNREALTMVQKDIMRVLVYKLRKREEVVLGDYKIYADQADEGPPGRIVDESGNEAGLQPDQLIMLRGVAVGRIDPKTNATRSDHTAEEADILVFRDSGRTWVQFRLKNALYHDESTGNPFVDSTDVGAQSADMLPNIEMPSKALDRPKALTWGELRELLVDPERQPRLLEQKAKLVEAVANEELLVRLKTGLEHSAATYGSPEPLGVRLRGAREDQHFVVSAAGAGRDAKGVFVAANSSRPTRIDLYEKGDLIRRYEARGEVRFETATIAAGSEPRLAPHLKNLSIIDPRHPDRTTERSEITLSRLWWPQPIIASLVSRPSGELATRAAADYPSSADIQRGAYMVTSQISRQYNRVISEIHERVATAFGCMLTSLLGAIMSLRLRGRLPLVVYFWTFLIVLATTLVLQTGSRLATDASYTLATGLIILWLSIIALAGILGYFYAKVTRN